MHGEKKYVFFEISQTIKNRKPYDQVIILVVIYPEKGKALSQKDTYTKITIIALIATAKLIYRVYHEKSWAGESRSWNQDCWEKCQ